MSGVLSRGLFLQVPDEKDAAIATGAGKIPLLPARGKCGIVVEVDRKEETVASFEYERWGTVTRKRTTLNVVCRIDGRESWKGTATGEDPPLPNVIEITDDMNGIKITNYEWTGNRDACLAAGKALASALGWPPPPAIPGDEEAAERFDTFHTHCADLLGEFEGWHDYARSAGFAAELMKGVPESPITKDLERALDLAGIPDGED